MSIESTLLVYTTPRASGKEIVDKRLEVDRAMDAIRAQQTLLFQTRCKARRQKKFSLLFFRER